MFQEVRLNNKKNKTVIINNPKLAGTYIEYWLGDEYKCIDPNKLNEHIFEPPLKQIKNWICLIKNPNLRFVSSIHKVFMYPVLENFMYNPIKDKISADISITKKEHKKILKELELYINKEFFSEFVQTDSHLIPHHTSLLNFLNNILDMGISKKNIILCDISTSNDWFEQFLKEGEVPQQEKQDRNETSSLSKKICSELISNIFAKDNEVSSCLKNYLDDELNAYEQLKKQFTIKN